MYTFYKSKKLTAQLGKVIKKLPYVFDEKAFKEAIEGLGPEEYEELKQGLKGIKKEVPLKWNSKPTNLYSLEPENIKLIDLLSAWSRESFYLSHFSALYFNELTEQRPSTHYLSHDVLNHPKSNGDPVDLVIMKQSFMKSPRVTSRFANYKKDKIYFIEKIKNTVGIENIKFHQDDAIYDLRVTNLERTLIDCAIAPHYSGGLPTVLKSYTSAKVGLKKLKESYDSLNLIYPYWQRIGFFLKAAGHFELALKWKNQFGTPNMEFYLDHEYRSTWKLDEEFLINYPSGLL